MNKKVMRRRIIIYAPSALYLLFAIITVFFTGSSHETDSGFWMMPNMTHAELILIVLTIPTFFLLDYIENTAVFDLIISPTSQPISNLHIPLGVLICNAFLFYAFFRFLILLSDLFSKFTSKLRESKNSKHTVS